MIIIIIIITITITLGGSGGNAEGGGTVAGGAYPRGAALLLVEPRDFWEGASLGGKGRE